MGEVSLLLERDGRVARLRIDNPPLNILTTAVARSAVSLRAPAHGGG